MTLLVIGLCLFFIVHLLPSFVPLKQALQARLGAGPYKGLFALVSAIGLALIIYGKTQAPYVALWQAPTWTRHLALTAMPFALILLAGAYLPSNIKRFTRHPMLWGVTIWAGAHLLANGDTASVLLFGAFGAYALFAMWSANRRGAVLSTMRHAVTRDLAVVLVGSIAYIALLMGHRFLFGVSPLA